MIDAMDPIFGCVFDGETDTYSALQAAFNAAEGDVLMLPAGRARLSQDLIVPSNIRIVGYPGFTWLMPVPGSTSNPLIWTVSAKSDVTFYGIGIDGEALTVEGFNAYCSNYNSSRIRYEQCHVRNTKGISIATTGNTSFEDVVITDGRFDNCGQYNLTSGRSADRRDAVWFGGSGGANGRDLIFRNNKAKAIGLSLCSFAGGINFGLSKCQAKDNILTDSNGGGIYASHINGYNCRGNHIDGIDGNALDNLTIRDFTITGNVLTGNSASGIGVFESSKHGTIADNVCFDNVTQNPSPTTHKGGITLTALNGEVTEDITLSGNVCHDTREGSITVTQRYAVGVVRAGSGQFKDIHIERSNRFSGYSALGVKNDQYIYQTFDLGAQNFPAKIILAANSAIALCDELDRGNILLHIENTSRQASISLRGPGVPIINYENIKGDFSMADAGLGLSLFKSGGKVMMRNRTGSDKSIFVSRELVL